MDFFTLINKFLNGKLHFQLYHLAASMFNSPPTMGEVSLERSLINLLVHDV